MFLNCTNAKAQNLELWQSLYNTTSTGDDDEEDDDDDDGGDDGGGDDDDSSNSTNTTRRLGFDRPMTFKERVVERFYSHSLVRNVFKTPQEPQSMQTMQKVIALYKRSVLEVEHELDYHMGYRDAALTMTDAYAHPWRRSLEEDDEDIYEDTDEDAEEGEQEVDSRESEQICFIYDSCYVPNATSSAPCSTFNPFTGQSFAKVSVTHSLWDTSCRCGSRTILQCTLLTC